MATNPPQPSGPTNRPGDHNPDHVMDDLRDRLTPPEFPRINRFILAAFGAGIYLALGLILLIILMLIYGPEVITPYVIKLVLLLPLLAWIYGWFGHYVEPGYEGVADFIGKKIHMFTLDNGHNWLPIGFNVEGQNMMWDALEIPLTAAERGFEVVSSDDVTLMTRTTVPWRYSDAFSAQVNFKKDAVISSLRTTAVEALRAASGLISSGDLQKKKQGPEIKNALRLELEGLMEEFPILINLDQIKISKFEAPDDIKESQRQKKKEEGQRDGEKVQTTHIGQMIEQRRLEYRSKGYGPREALSAARQDVLAELGKLNRESIEFTGGSDLTRAGALAGRGGRNPS